jgi:hypothetical protein
MHGTYRTFEQAFHRNLCGGVAQEPSVHHSYFVRVDLIGEEWKSDATVLS